jgi:hypothetical protein
VTAAAKAKSGTHWRRIIALTLFAGLMLAALALANSGRAAIETPPPPSVWSDKADYAPGEQVALSGANWAPGESVHIRVNDDAGETWRRDVDVTADESGAISDQFNLPDWFVAQYTVTATGASSGTATWSFTDGNVNAATVAMRNAACTTAQPGPSYTSGSTACAHVVATVNGGGSTSWAIQWFAPGVSGAAGPSAHAATFTEPAGTSTVTRDDTFAPSVTGTWTVVVCKTGDTEKCSAGNQVVTQTFTVTAANTPPVANAQAVSTNEDTPKTITLTGSDVDGNSLTFATGTGPSHGSLGSISAVTCTGTAPKSCSAEVTYTPALNYNGSDSFTFKVNDGTVDSPAATVSITINAVNDAPSCSAVSLTTDEDTPGDANPDCTDIDSASLSYAIVGAATHGTASIVAGKLHYVPNANYNGSDSFTYKANDGALDSNTATVSVTVNAVNDAPTCTNGSASTDEDNAVATPLSCADVDSATLGYTIVSGPAHGSLSGTAPNLTYTPNANYNGSDSFTFQASDGSLDSNVAAFNITINAVNDAPTATVSLNDHSPKTNDTLTATATRGDVDGDAVSLHYVWKVNGTVKRDVTKSAGMAVDLTDTFDLATGGNGDKGDVVRIEVTPNDGTVDGTTVNDVATVANSGPTAGVVAITPSSATQPTTNQTITSTASGFTDADGDSLVYTYTWKNGPTTVKTTPGSSSPTDTLDLSAMGNGNRGDTVSVEVTASDGSASSAAANDSVMVKNSPPTATNVLLNNTSPTTNQTISVSFSYADDDGDAQSGTTYQWQKKVGAGSFTDITGETSASLDLSTAGNGDKGNQLRVLVAPKDGTDFGTGVFSDIATVANSAPTVTLDAGNTYTYSESATAERTFNFTTSDADGDTLAITVNCGPGAYVTGSKTASSFKCVFDDGPVGLGSELSVSVDDGDGGTDSDSHEITINNVAPTVTFANDNDTLVNEGTTHTYSFTVTDPGDDDFSVLAFDCGTGGTVDVDSLATDASGGSFDCTFPDGPASTSVHVKVEDSDHVSDTDSEAIQVVHVANVAPSVTSAAGQSSNEGENHSFALGSFTDPGPDADWSVDVDWGDGSTHTTFTASDVGSLGSQTHTYTNGPSDYTVTVTVTDDEADPADQLSGSATFAVHVNNVAPSVTAAAGQSSNESENHSFALGSFTDPGPDGPWSVDVDWGDGSTHASFSKSGPGSLGTQDHIYADGPNDYTVTVKVAEAGSGTPPSGQATFAVHVNNVAPSGTLGNNGPISEGGSATISFSGVSDPSAADNSTLHYAFSCTGDSLAGATYASSSMSSSTSCGFSDGPSTPTVTGVIIDKDGGRHGDMTTITVNNVKPIVTAPADQNATEGSGASFTLGSFSDPGADSPWTGSVNWGDGSSNTGIGPFSSVGSLGSASHTFANSGTYTVKVSVTDKDGGTGYTTFKVTVSNVAPTVTAAANQSGDEGTEKNFDLGSFSDPGAEASWSVDVNWGDGSTHTTFTKSSTGSLGSRPHTYADNGSYTVTVKVSDDAGQGSASFTVTVGNVAPAPTWTSYSNILYGPMVFGLTGTWSGSFTDPGDDAPWTATFAWNGVNDTGQTKTFTSSDPKTFSVRPNFGTAGCQLTGKVTVTEQEGPSGTDTKTVSVGTGEFLPPMTNQPVTDKLKNGQVLPVKVRIADCNGNPISGLSPKIELKLGDLTSEVADNSVQPIDITNASSADTSGFMRAVDGSYMYNLRINVPTNTLNQAYTIVITPNAAGYPSGMTLRHKIVATK